MTYRDPAYEQDEAYVQSILDDETFTYAAPVRPRRRIRSTAFIWRVEDDAGQGFYRRLAPPWEPRGEDGGPNPMHLISFRAAKALATAPSPSRPMPCVPEDTEAYYYGEQGDGLCGRWRIGYHLSGFNSVAQARAWFSFKADMIKLGNAGWRLIAYRRVDLAEVAIGGHQVVFAPPRPDTRRAVLSLADLWQLSPADLVNLALRQLEA